LPKGPNPLEPVELTVTVNVQTAWYLDRLVERGLYGNSRTDAVKVVLFDHCKLLIGQGKLKDAPDLAGSSAVAIGP
jgi:hypothetical protein